jgi:hypothetical protein
MACHGDSFTFYLVYTLIQVVYEHIHEVEPKCNVQCVV